MKESLLDDIREHGHWRVNLRPLSPLDQKISLRDCQDLVRNNRVSLRGWDFPHISNRNDDQGGSGRFGQYVENWTQWYVHWEFWRMYRSGQFLAYKLVSDELENEHGEIHQEKILRLINTVYTITEFIEFAYRMYSKPPFGKGVNVDISLLNSNGRELKAGGGRIPFSEQKISMADKILLHRSVKAEDLASKHRGIAIDLIVELFDYFGWNPSQDQIRADQDRLYSRQL